MTTHTADASTLARELAHTARARTALCNAAHAALARLDDGDVNGACDTLVSAILADTRDASET